MDQEHNTNVDEPRDACWLENRTENCLRKETRKRSLWDQLRATGRSEGEPCRIMKSDVLLERRPTEFLCTGRKYSGTWDKIGMNGHGVYTLPNGVSYVGGMKDGMFDGAGILMFTDGSKIQGTWRRNELIRRTLVFPDGLKYSESNWNYCQTPDRRFQIEHEQGLRAAGQSYMTNHQPTRAVPDGMFDVEDGFYDPKTKMVYDLNNLNSIKRAPSSEEQHWMMTNCRTTPDHYRGPCRHLYEEWTEPTVFGLSEEEEEKLRNKTVTIERQ